MQALEHRRGRAARHNHADPKRVIRVGHPGFHRGGYLRQGGRARGRAHGQRLQLAVFDERQGGGQRGKKPVVAATNHIGHGLGRAFIGHMQGVNAGLQAEFLGIEVGGAAHAG